MTDEIKKARGGARDGAGRKKNEGKDITKKVQFRLTQEQEIMVKEFVKLLKKQGVTLNTLDNINFELRNFYIEHLEDLFKERIEKFE